ncbi:hypothetical protein Tco_1562474 [Tanacetum coccineum]
MSMEALQAKSDELLCTSYSGWNRPLVYCDDVDDEDEHIAITPESNEEPVNSLLMERSYLTQFRQRNRTNYKVSVEFLCPIPSESKVFQVCDVPYHDNSPPLDIQKINLRIFSVLS